MEPKRPNGYNLAFIWRICLVAALGGLLFGYDWVVIGGAKPFFVRYFGLQDGGTFLGTPFEGETLIGWAMSSALMGCIIGSLVSGTFSDIFGRRRLLIISGMFFIVSAIGTGIVDTFSFFVLYRFLGGVGIGMASNLSPIYIAEVTPATMRGKFVSINQLTIVLGVLGAQIVNWLIARNMPEGFTETEILESWYGSTGWRWMFAAETIPALFFFTMMFLVPESPRWLIKKGNKYEALRILAKIGGTAYSEKEVEEIQKTLSDKNPKLDFREHLNWRVLKFVGIGMCLATLQQWCGINMIFYYAENIFKAAGYNISSIMLNIVWTGLFNLAFTLFAILMVDRMGRKPLMLAGTGGLFIIHAIIGICFHIESCGLHMLALFLLAIGCYAFSLAPVTWVLLSELFPNRIRAAAMAVSVSALWVSCFLMTQFFPKMEATLGMAWNFGIFSGVCLAGFLFVLFLIPETRGKTLEQIEKGTYGLQYRK